MSRKTTARMVGPFLRLPTHRVAGANIYVQLQHVVCITGNNQLSRIQLVGDEGTISIDMPLTELLEVIDAIAN